MLTMNRATLVGHAGRNPEMRTLPSGDEVALFSLATTERFKRRDGSDGEATEWHAIVAFGAAAEAVRKLVRRGDPVLVEGRIGTRTWTDRKGAEHRTSEIVVAGPRGQVNVLAKRRRDPDGHDEPPGGAAPAGAAKAADGIGNEETADAVAAAASDRTDDTGTGKMRRMTRTADGAAGTSSEGRAMPGRAGRGSPPIAERTRTPARMPIPPARRRMPRLPKLPPPARRDAAGCGDTTGAASEAMARRGRHVRRRFSEGGVDDAGTGETEGADAGDAVAAGADGRPGQADHD